MIAGHLNLELIPDAVHRRAVLSSEDEAHLLVCAECRAEWDLVRAAALLGAGQLVGFDAERVAGGVRARLAVAPAHPRHFRWWPVALAAAAMLLVSVWYSRSGPVDPNPASVAPPAEMVLHELDSLNVAQLERVLADIPPETNHVEQLPLSDLSTEDLERVLRSMEE